MIGKAQIGLGKTIISVNLQKEIALSPMDLELNKAKVTLMMGGGWDHNAHQERPTIAHQDGWCPSVLAQTKYVVYSVLFQKVSRTKSWVFCLE
jgi:hypothetical protein